MEAEAEEQQGAAEARVRVPGEGMRASSPVAGARGSDGDQEAFLQEAWREEVEV